MICTLIVKLLNLVLIECVYNIMEIDGTDQLEQAKHGGVEHMLEVRLNVASLIYRILLLRYSVIGYFPL